MAANNYNKYDEDFKKTLVSLHQNGNPRLNFANNMGVRSPHLVNG